MAIGATTAGVASILSAIQGGAAVAGGAVQQVEPVQQVERGE